jgi:serine/threonine protein kinase
MVMELLGKSLEDLFQEHKKHFSMHTVCMIGTQMLERIEFIHNKHIIHRDIKPDNFVMGLGTKNTTVYILDFGLAKKYRSSRTLQHIKFNINRKLTGTARYASINALRGCEQSRRDDLEAIGYVLMYFLRGSLPWQGLRVDKRDDRYKKIYEKKKATTPEELCYGFPNEFTEYVKYTRNLDFEQNPDYNYLKTLFDNVMKANNVKNDFMFDWLSEKERSVVSSNIENLKMNKGDNKEEQQDDKENNLNAFANKHLMTNVNGDNDNAKIYSKQGNERLGTQFANYNTHVEVTENEQNGIRKYEQDNKRDNADVKGNDAVKERDDEKEQQVNGNNNKQESKDKKKKNKKDKCVLF